MVGHSRVSVTEMSAIQKTQIVASLYLVPNKTSAIIGGIHWGRLKVSL